VSRARKLLLTVLLLGAGGVAAGAGTWSAFSATTANSGNGFAAGTVTVGDNDAGGALVSLPANAKPGDTSTRCVLVSYTGSLPSTVRMYATVSGALAPYLSVTVTRGTDSSPSFPSCAGFVPDPVNYGTGTIGVVYQGKLSGLPSTWAGGIVDPMTGSPESWTQSEAHAYRYVVSVDNDPAAQGVSAAATFHWEARNQ